MSPGGAERDFEVLRVEDVKIDKGVRYYRVIWEPHEVGSRMSDVTWEPEVHLQHLSHKILSHKILRGRTRISRLYLAQTAGPLPDSRTTTQRVPCTSTQDRHCRTQDRHCRTQDRKCASNKLDGGKSSESSFIIRPFSFGLSCSLRHEFMSLDVYKRMMACALVTNGGIITLLLD